MANGHGGKRAGAGRPPTNLRATIGFRQAGDGEQVPVTVTDVVVETMGMGGFLKDAAARIGVPVDALRTWRTLGHRSLGQITTGQRRRSEMSQHERNCMAMAARMDEAEAGARTRLLDVAGKLAHGGLTRTETTIKTTQPTVDGVLVGEPIEVERVTREIEAGPDGHMIGWLLQHRWPADFNRSRLEVTGADGGAILVDSTPIVEKVRAHLADIRSARAETDPEALQAMVAGNGNGAATHDP